MAQRETEREKGTVGGKRGWGVKHNYALTSDWRPVVFERERSSIQKCKLLTLGVFEYIKDLNCISVRGIRTCDTSAEKGVY